MNQLLQVKFLLFVPGAWWLCFGIVIHLDSLAFYCHCRPGLEAVHKTCLTKGYTQFFNNIFLHHVIKVM